ncbi:MAG: response regulator transcription factor [Roseiflexaceae bacterium]
MQTEVLLVEDDSRARMLLSDVLTHAGYKVTTAADGEQALKLLDTPTEQPCPFHIVVSDIRLGGVDGIQVLQYARQTTNPPEVILLTGYGSIETAVAALRLGAFDYLLKPFAPADLLGCVLRAIEQKQAEQRQSEAIRVITSVVNQLRMVTPPIAEQPAEPAVRPPQVERFVQVGALTLDRFRHAASFEDKPLRLTPIEYALLLCLGEMQGRVIGYADIVRRTHGYTVEDSEAQGMLKVHVHNLRQKIDPNYLVNVRGTGYMLAAPE